MEFNNQWMLARCEILRYEDADLDLVITNLLVRGAVDMEAVKASGRRRIIKRSHVQKYSYQQLDQLLLALVLGKQCVK
jgi:hypothetical protein